MTERMMVERAKNHLESILNAKYFDTVKAYFTMKNAVELLDEALTGGKNEQN